MASGPNVHSSFEKLYEDTLTRLRLVERRLAIQGGTPVPTTGTTALRDTTFGVPATAAEQSALANQKVPWFNTDLGWEESYYATTGTAGLTVLGLETGVPSGWYPVGPGPECMMEPTTTFAATVNNYIGNWNGAVRRRGGAAWFATTSVHIQMLVPGVYDFGWFTLQAQGTGTADYHTRLLNSAGNVLDWMSNRVGETLTTLYTPAEAHYKSVYVRTGQRLTVYLSAGSLTVHQVTGGATYPSMRGQMYAKWVRPALVSE